MKPKIFLRIRMTSLIFALALKLNCAINDRKLKEQNAVKVYTTQEIIQMLELYFTFRRFKSDVMKL